MPSKPVLTDTDKQNIKKRLQQLCEQFLISNGYKKTSVKELCQNAEISIGTFYSIYPAKEDLFLETAMLVQSRLKEQFLTEVQKKPNKIGFATAMKMLFREFDNNIFLHNVCTSDFEAFVLKLPPDAVEKIKFDSMEMLRKSIKSAQLQLQVDESTAYGVLSMLSGTLETKHRLTGICDYFEILDFMIDHLVSDLFV